MIQILGFNGHQPTINESRRLADSVINNGSDIATEMKQHVFSVFVFNGDSATIDHLLKVRILIIAY